MSGLNTSLMVAMQSLAAEEGALQITNNNIANANTPGYSRQVALFTQASVTQEGEQTVANGAVLQGFQSVRDELLQMQIQQQTQQQSSADTQVGLLSQIQTTFSSSGQDIGSQLSAFFSSISALSATPTSSSARQAVLAAAQNLTAAFHTAASTLTQVQQSADQQASETVGQINQLTGQIAQLNAQINQAQSDGQNTGPLEDQRDQLVQQLSQLTDVQVTQSESGETLTTGNGSPLVVGSQSFQLSTTTGANGLQQILDSSGHNITSAITGGQLGGDLQVRDQTLPAMQQQLDVLANQFASAFNAAQAQGFDQNGNSGQALFTVPGTVAGSAARIQVATTDLTAIAASSDGSSGSNGNLTNLLAVQNNALASGQSPTDAYSSIVFQVGNSTSQAQAESSAALLSLQQLNNQLSSISGVSIDEESTNLIRFQQAYEAAARVINTITQLDSVTLNMGSSTGGY